MIDSELNAFRQIKMACTLCFAFNFDNILKYLFLKRPLGEWNTRHALMNLIVWVKFQLRHHEQL